MKIASKIIATASAASLYAYTAVSTFAATTDTVTPCPRGIGNVCSPNSVSLNDLITRILNYLFIGGAIIAVIFLIIGGIRYITAGGDKTKVGTARETIIGAIIGLVIIFAAYFVIAVVLKTFFGFDLSGGFAIPSLF